MGAKILQATMGLTAVAIAIGALSLCLPLHVLWWFAGPLPLFTVNTKALWVNVDCVKPMPDSLCKHFEGDPTLEEFAQRSCNDFVHTAVANLCEGSYNAFVIGLMLVIVFAINVLLQGAAMYSFNYYMGSSMRKKYRQLGVILQSIGVLCLVFVLVLYYAMVVVYMDGVTFKVMPVFGPSHGANASFGYIFMWVSCFLQVGSIMISVVGSRSSQEDLVEEAREQAKFAAEMGGMEMTSNVGQQGMQPQMQPYPGMQPQMQPQMGMYQPGMGGFQQQGFQQPGFR